MMQRAGNSTSEGITGDISSLLICSRYLKASAEGDDGSGWAVVVDRGAGGEGADSLEPQKSPQRGEQHGNKRQV